MSSGVQFASICSYAVVFLHVGVVEMWDYATRVYGMLYILYVYVCVCKKLYIHIYVSIEMFGQFDAAAT